MLKIALSEAELTMVMDALNEKMERIDCKSHRLWKQGCKEDSLASDAIANQFDELIRQLRNGRRNVG